MKAFRLQRYGGPDCTVMEDIAGPVPGPRDLLVRVAGMGLNPLDFKTRQGKLKAIQKLSLPITLGNEVSGEVIAVGSHATKFKVGDKIIARVEKNRLGAFAELACIDESTAALAPKSIPLIEAAGLPLAGLTSLQALRDELQVGPAKHVLITAGAGGVGTLAIQIAKWLGAEVSTTASTRGAELVRSLGADHVIDYTTTDLTTLGRKFDAVFDLVGGETLAAAFQVAKPGAMVLSIAGMPEPETARKDLRAGFALQAMFWLASFSLRRKAAANDARYRFMFMHPSGAELSELVNLIDTGKLKIITDRTFPFVEMPAAIAHLENGRAKGKVIVTNP